MNTELSVEELIDPLQTVIGVVEKNNRCRYFPMF